VKSDRAGELFTVRIQNGARTYSDSSLRMCCICEGDFGVIGRMGKEKATRRDARSSIASRQLGYQVRVE
jgi:hypothetical protein